MKLRFDTNGNDKQKEVCRYWIDPEIFDVTYGGSKGSGKSYLGVSLIFGDAFIYPGTQYFIGRRELNDLRKYTSTSVYEVFDHWKIPKTQYKYDGKDNYFKLRNGSHVFFIEAAYKPADPLYQRFGGMQMTRGWIEEAGEIHVAAKNNLTASVGRWKNDIYNLPGKVLQTCNPSKNYLYRDYYKKFKEGTLEPWRKFVQALPEDNKRLQPGYLDNLRRTLNKNEKERLLFGNWEYDDDPNSLCGYDEICNIFTNQFVLGGKRYITGDIARFGKDSTLCKVWDGWRVLKRVQKNKLKVTESAELIRSLANDFQVPMSQTIVDEDGIGGGVVDLLGCVGFIANSSPFEIQAYDALGNQIVENYDNLKSQCGFKLANVINSNGIYEPCAPEVSDLITEELEQLKQKSVDKLEKKGLIPKDKIKEMIVRSPDDLDNYIMRAYFDVCPASASPSWSRSR